MDGLYDYAYTSVVLQRRPFAKGGRSGLSGCATDWPTMDSYRTSYGSRLPGCVSCNMCMCVHVITRASPKIF